MSLIVGRYYRGNPKQKPKQWGSTNAICDALYNNVEKIFHIDPSTIIYATPIWDGAGTTIHDYSNYNVPSVFYPEGSSYWTSRGIYYNYYNGYTSFDKPNIVDHFSFIINVTMGSNTGYILSFGSSYGAWGIRVSAGAINFIRVSHSTRGTFVAASDFVPGKEYQFGMSHYNTTPTQKLYTNGRHIASDSTIFSDGGALKYGFGGNISGTYNGISGYIDEVVFFNTILSDSQFALLSDNRYALWQPPAFRTYFDLSTEAPTERWPKQRTLTGPFWGPFGGI